MEKSATVGVVGRLGGLYDDDEQLRSSPSEKNGLCRFETEENETVQIRAQLVQHDIAMIKKTAHSIWCSIAAMNFTEGTKIQIWALSIWDTIEAAKNLTESKKIQIWAQSIWGTIAAANNLTPSNKTQLWAQLLRRQVAEMGKPIVPVTDQYSCEVYLGQPMKQRKPNTCSPVASTFCVYAVHRFKYEKKFGLGKFPFTALEPDDLIEACTTGKKPIWTPHDGAYTRDVLAKIQEMGGVPATTTTGARRFLPLRSFKQHRWDNYADGGLSASHVAELLSSHGPCIGVLWVCPWYHHFDADHDDNLVYRGCGRNEDDRKQSEKLYGDQVGSHAVVCVAYRFCGDQMHVLVLDNHSDTGPRRWVDFEELDTLYTLTVDP